MGLLEFVLATGLIGVGAWGATCWMRPIVVGEAVIAFMALGYVGIMLNTLVVGVLFQSYRPGWLLLGAAAFATVGLAGARRRRNPFRIERRALPTALRHALSHPVLVLLLALILVVYLFRAWLSIRLPPSDWDSLMYHLIGPDRWVQSGRIGRSPENIWSDTYPMGVESIEAWPMAFLHTIQYCPLVLMPFYALGAVSVWCIAHRLGARGSHATLAGIVFLLTPAVFAMAHTSYVDVPAATFGLVVVALLGTLRPAVNLAPRPTAALLRRLTIIGAVLGAAVAGKSSNLVLVAVIFPAVAYHVYSLTRPAGGAKTAPRPSIVISAATAFITPALAVGAYWYLRTWVNHGNPFYPVSMLGFSGWGSAKDVIVGPLVPDEIKDHGTLSQLLISWGHGFTLGDKAISYDERLGALGMLWPMFVLPAGLAGLLWWHTRAHRRGPGYLLALVALAVFAMSPAAWWGRYVLLGYAAVLPLMAYTLTRLTAHRRLLLDRSLHVLVAACLIVTAWWGHQYFRMLTPGKHYVHSASAPDNLSLSDVLSLTSDPQRGTAVDPWYSYQAANSLPKGSVISLVTMRKVARLLQPLIGIRLQHRLTMLPAPIPATTAELGAKMAAAHSTYVLIDDIPELNALAAQVASDHHHYRKLATFPAHGTLYQLFTSP